ncbi:hypothetical protein UA08_06248 [Talaromyces atroroseus]|uniref:Uncharacterized protein n=1 Tax=Talaromyces atroroseus TaxID=1441469 RepID=A0A225AH27_TALAT|nr:hypothetical protein UA08_06248 [Talaromyces atroroseus]OKL58523.1 hypothetical protein UA08_06248 [Talaromyces atroroseus]
MSDAASQPRRSRRFSFTSRRQQNPAQEDVHHGPPPTTIGFPIDAIPFYPESQAQENSGSSWKRAFRRSQSVDRAEQPSDRRPSRRLVKKPPVSGSRRDASVSSEAPRKSMISSISTRIRSRRASTSNNGEDAAGLQLPDEQAGERGAESSHPYRYDRISSRGVAQKPGHTHAKSLDAAQEGQKEMQKELRRKSELVIKREDASATPTPTLRRVGSPFYHTASDKEVVSQENPPTSEPKWPKLEIPASTNLESWRDEAMMIPASLRVSRSKIVEPGPKSPSRASLSMQENNDNNKDDTSQHSLPKYSPPHAQVPGPQKKESSNRIESSLSSLWQEPLPFEQVAPKPASKPVEQVASIPRPLSQNDKSTTHEWVPPVPSESINPVKTMSPRPRHAKHTKTQSSSSTATASSSSSSPYSYTSSTFGELPTPISSNASSTHLEATTNNNTNDTAKKEIPRNTMSPKLDKYLAKIFVICCHCNHWHDVPSPLYAQMIIPERLLFSGLPEPSETRSSKSSRSSSQARESARLSSEYSRKKRPQSYISQSDGSSSYSATTTSLPSSSHSRSPSRSPFSSPTATVLCSWCKHEMAQSCCASWTTMVHMIERH